MIIFNSKSWLKRRKENNSLDDIELHFHNDMIDVLGECAETRALSEDGTKPMIICQCNGISDRTIRKAVRNGASNRSDIVRACTAGTACGGCAPAIDEIIKAEREQIARPGLTVLELATS